MNDGHPPFDPDLPILAELEDVLRPLSIAPGEALDDVPRVTPLRAVPDLPAVAAPAAEPLAEPAPAPPREPRHRPRRGERGRLRGSLPGLARRTGHRAVAVLGILALIGGTAFAASFIGHGHHQPLHRLNLPAMVQLGQGSAGGDTWQLEAYRRGNEACHAFFVEGVLANSCGAPPAPETARIDGALSGTTRYVLGLAGREVAALRMTVGGAHSVVPTHLVPTRSLAGAGLPAGSRWFVAALPRRAHGREAPAYLTPLDANEQPLVDSSLDCSVGAVTRPCQRVRQR